MKAVFYCLTSLIVLVLISCTSPQVPPHWDKAVRITYVAEGSPAAMKGIVPGSIVTQISETAITNTEQLKTILEIERNSDTVVAWVIWVKDSPKFYVLPTSLEDAGIHVVNGGN